MSRAAMRGLLPAIAVTDSLSRRRLLFLAFIAAAAKSMPALAQEAPQGFVLYGSAQPLPDARFVDASGASLRLSAFRGKVLLLNVWATWCGPCRKEMPTLDRLQAKLGGGDFQVIPLSTDSRGFEAIDVFFREIGATHLGKFLDVYNEAMGNLNIVGIPTTLLIDRQGRELGRLVGPAEWDSPDMIAFLQGIIARKPAP